MKKTTILNKSQRETIIDKCIEWFEDWKLNEPTVYTESVTDRRQIMEALNNSDLMKHVYEFYALDIWDYV
mgnify:CR=1 FL=1